MKHGYRRGVSEGSCKIKKGLGLKESGIYLLHNVETNENYIGSSSDLKSRFRWYRFQKENVSDHFLYGKSNIKWGLLIDNLKDYEEGVKGLPSYQPLLFSREIIDHIERQDDVYDKRRYMYTCDRDLERGSQKDEKDDDDGVLDVVGPESIRMSFLELERKYISHYKPSLNIQGVKDRTQDKFSEEEFKSILLGLEWETMMCRYERLKERDQDHTSVVFCPEKDMKERMSFDKRLGKVMSSMLQKGFDLKGKRVSTHYCYISSDYELSILERYFLGEGSVSRIPKIPKIPKIPSCTGHDISYKTGEYDRGVESDKKYMYSVVRKRKDVMYTP